MVPAMIKANVDLICKIAQEHVVQVTSLSKSLHPGKPDLIPSKDGSAAARLKGASLTRVLEVHCSFDSG